MSWKARRASARCLGAVIQTHPEMLPLFYQKVVVPLVHRFRERVDHVVCLWKWSNSVGRGRGSEVPRMTKDAPNGNL